MIKMFQKLLYLFLILSLMFIYCIPVFADGPSNYSKIPFIEWSERYDCGKSGGFNDIKSTNDGGYILVGSKGNSNDNLDYYIVKLSSDRTIQWQKMLGGSKADRAKFVSQTSDGGYIIIGETFSTDGDISGNTAAYNIWVVKLSRSGNIEWKKCVADEEGNGVKMVQQTEDGSYIIAGDVLRASGDIFNGGKLYFALKVVKINSYGSVKWRKDFDGDFYLNTYQQTKDSGFIITKAHNKLMRKIDKDGNTVWEKSYNSKYGAPVSIQETKDGGLILHDACIHQDSDNDFWITKLDERGSIEWEKSYKCRGYDNINEMLYYGHHIRQTSDGGYLVFGTIGSNHGAIDENNGGNDIWVAKLESNGCIEWEKCYGGSNNEFCNGVLQTKDDEYFIVGTSSSSNGDVVGSGSGWFFKLAHEDKPPVIDEVNLSSTTSDITVYCRATDSGGLAEKPYCYTIGTISTDWLGNSNYKFTSLTGNQNYTVNVRVKDKGGNISTSTKNIYTKAEVPTITVNNPTSITLGLTIEDNNSSNTAYQIVNTSNNNYISPSGEETTSPTWLIPQNKTITIKGLTPLTTYTYKVKAKNEEAIETEFSSPASGTTLAPPPEKVSEVTATATSNEITIFWNPVDNATSYEVEADGGEPIDNGTNLSYIHTELLPNSEHTYRVRAKNGTVTGEWSEAITKSTLPLTPVIPTNINTLSTENTITLTWNAVGNAVSYDIEVDGEVISNGNSTNYVHTGLLPNTTHSYRIRSINPAGKSEWSSEVTAKTITDSLPTPMNIVANSGKTSVEIKWNEIVGMEYQIEADGNIIDNGFNCIYIHSGLTPDTGHTYRVRSHKGGSYSDWSSPIMVRTSKDIFTAPSNIKSSATDTSIMISWEEVTGADGYDAEADGLIVDNGLNTSFTHEGLMPNTSHIYRIRARQGDTVSDWSSAINIVNISTYALATPKNLRATATETEIVVNWDMVTDADSYDIKINNDLIENITDTTYTISGLVPGTQKKIMVRAVNANGTSAFSVPITVITKASSSDSPQNISALTTKNQITLMWEPIQGAVSYDIEANGAVTSSVSANSYTFAELQPNITYTYKIRVNKEDGMQGQWSKAVTVTTMADAPDAPLNLTASSTLNSVRLSWDGAVGAVEYEVEAGGQILNAGASNNYLITGLTPNTEYSYKVRAKNPTTVGSWSQPITIKTKSSIQNYNINGNIGEEKNLVLNAIDIRDFEKYTFTITYNPDEIEIVDIASQTARPDLSIGNIGGTDIEVIQNTPGTLQFKKISPLPIGQSYSGIINSIRLKFKVDKEAVITYTIQ